MEESIVVARLDGGDVAALRALNALFAEAFFEPETYDAQPPPEAYLRRWLDRSDNIALAAFSGTTIVGGLVAYVLEKFEQTRTEVFIYDLAVAETHRRRGVATALIRRLQQIATQLRAWVIFVQADYGDDPAIALYAKLGSRKEVLHFDIPVRS